MTMPKTNDPLDCRTPKVHVAIRAAIEKYLTENGAAPVCKTHLEPLTKVVVEAFAEAMTNKK